MYTTTTINKSNGIEQVSRYFETKKAAVRWFKWLSSQEFVSQVKLYHGQAGGELLSVYPEAN